ncbi:MAG: B12-binding domain-containing radical SAM protein [Promethearchaeota archaeon]
MITENIIVKDWRKIDFSFGLVYPNLYKLGMSSYSIRLLYFLINSYDNVACERIFLPESIKYPANKDYSSINELRSIENKVLPNAFDILGFSIHFENDIKNILWILEKSNIPLTSQERLILTKNEKETYPIIIGGGPVVTSNPLPISKIFDIFFIGDSEPNLDLFFRIFNEFKENRINFHELLKKATKIKGIFIPLLDNKVERSLLEKLDNSPIPIYQTITKTAYENNIFLKNFFVEINRGCPFKCKFCISSFHNFPFRNRSYENVINAIDRGVESSNFDTISLIGSCVSSHPKFKEICQFIISKEKRLTIPSIRIEHITNEIINILEMGDIKTITIAPEAGTEDLRYELGKKISNDKICSVLTQIKDSKIKNIKFYFLIGLPNEKDENIDDIIELLKNITNIGFESNSLRVNINPFIPKLNTPYEKEIDFYLKENFPKIKKDYLKLEQELKKIPSIKIKFKNIKEIIKSARLQTLLSLGDQTISDLLINYYKSGAHFGALRKAEKEMNFSLDEYLLKIKDCYCPWSI